MSKELTAVQTQSYNFVGWDMSKKTVAFLIVILFASFCAYSLHMGYGNDRWTLGLGENTDDLLTGSVHLRQGFNDFYASLDFLTITNRGTKEFDGVFRKGRTDVMNIAVAYAPKPLRVGDTNLFLKYEAATGLSIKGNLGSEFIQNLIHTVVGNPPLSLPVSGETKALPLIDLKAYGSLDFSDYIGLGLTASYHFDSSGSQLNALLETKATYRGFSARIGVDYTRVWSSDWILQTYAEAIDGFGIDFGLMAGKAISFSYRLNPVNGRCYGVIAVDTDGFKPEWTESIARFVVSKEILSGVSEATSLTMEHRLSDFFDAGFELRYTSGFRNNRKANNDEFRISRNYSHWLVGISFHWNLGFVDPYLNLRGGLSAFRINKLTYINPESTDHSELLADKWFPTVSMELGIRFLPEGLIIVGPTSMRISLFCGIDWIPKDLEKTLVKDNLHDGWSQPPILMHYGIGFVFGF